MTPFDGNVVHDYREWSMIRFIVFPRLFGAVSWDRCLDSLEEQLARFWPSSGRIGKEMLI